LQKKRKWKTPKKELKKAAKVLILAQKTHIRDAKTTFLVCFFCAVKSVFGHPKMPSFFCQNQPSKALFQRAFCFSKRCFPLPSKKTQSKENSTSFSQKAKPSGHLPFKKFFERNMGENDENFLSLYLALNLHFW
jgi:hypothetical protein